ncbi:MAG: nucleotidyl transferase AbiEii/AbiGii toxin family protein [Sedimentisphaerales bacterium]|nr:nucleotidyl transferase AbiEii/AbiGii toxin family protein [Sedimentisphaerales bacterium]
MKSLFTVAAELQEFLLDMRWEFCFIGGIALQRWGQPRLTVDVDLSLLAEIGSEQWYVDKLCEAYSGRVQDARAFALQHRVLLLQSEDGIPLDIALACFPYEETMIRRATDFEFTQTARLRTCSAEDLIIVKAFADRTRDWADIESIITRQRDSLDLAYVKRQLEPLCELKESPAILERLCGLLDATD